MAARRSGVDRGFPRFLSSAFWCSGVLDDLSAPFAAPGAFSLEGVFFPPPNISARELSSTRDNHTPQAHACRARRFARADGRRPPLLDFVVMRAGEFFFARESSKKEASQHMCYVDDKSASRLIPAPSDSPRASEEPQHVAHEIERSRDEHVHPPPRVDAPLLPRDDSNPLHRLAKARHHRRRR